MRPRQSAAGMDEAIKNIGIEDMLLRIPTQLFKPYSDIPGGVSQLSKMEDLQQAEKSYLGHAEPGYEGRKCSYFLAKKHECPSARIKEMLGTGRPNFYLLIQ